MIKPPFITDPTDSYSEEFRLDCLAWRLFTQKTDDGLEKYFSKQKPGLRAQLEPRLVRCTAWQWLCEKPPQQIRTDLLRVPRHERDHFRAGLNELREAHKATQQTAGEANG